MQINASIVNGLISAAAEHAPGVSLQPMVLSLLNVMQAQRHVFHIP